MTLKDKQRNYVAQQYCSAVQKVTVKNENETAVFFKFYLQTAIER